MSVFQAAMALEDDRTTPDGGDLQPCTAWMTLLKRQLTRAQKVGQIAQDVDLDDEAWLMISILYGTYQLADRLGSLRELGRRVEQALLPALDSLTSTSSRQLLDAAQQHAREYLAAV